MFKFNVTLRRLLPVLTTAMLVPCAALAQQGRTTDPNMGHFYMARQQVTITDDGPIVNNKQTQPGAQGTGGMPAQLQQGLPAARWSQYAPAENPNLSTSLPKVVNGVPPKMPPQTASPVGKGAKAGKLGPAVAKQPVVKQAPSTAAYAPYKKFSPDAAVTGASDAQSQSNVKGDVLHWVRRGHGM